MTTLDRLPAAAAMLVLAAAQAGPVTAQAQEDEPRVRDVDALTTPIPGAVSVENVPDEDVVAEDEELGTAIIEVRRLTPVRPEAPGEVPQRAYQIYWEIDLPVLGAGAALAAARLFRAGGDAERAPCLLEEVNGFLVSKDRCDPSEINPFDRIVAGRYNNTWADISDVGLLSLAVAPPILLTADSGILPALNDMVVVYQSGLLAVAFSGLATLTGARARPFVFGTEAPVETRTSGEGSLSFVSSHASFSFALATSMFWTIERRHGDSPLTWATLAVGESIASLVALSRVMAGRHFPTDVIAGAVVGISVGTLVPTLHGSPVRVTAAADADGAQAAMSVAF